MKSDSIETTKKYKSVLEDLSLNYSTPKMIRVEDHRKTFGVSTQLYTTLKTMGIFISLEDKTRHFTYTEPITDEFAEEIKRKTNKDTAKGKGNGKKKHKSVSKDTDTITQKYFDFLVDFAIVRKKSTDLIKEKHIPCETIQAAQRIGIAKKMGIYVVAEDTFQSDSPTIEMAIRLREETRNVIREHKSPDIDKKVFENYKKENPIGNENVTTEMSNVISNLSNEFLTPIIQEAIKDFVRNLTFEELKKHQDIVIEKIKETIK
jgi:hypothetical protein